MSFNHTTADFEIREFLESISCPRALTVWLLFSSGEHKQLTELTFDPEAYPDAEAVRRALCATSLLSKADFLKTNVDTKAVALQKFRDAEAICYKTNSRILRSTYDYKYTPTILSIAARKIERILGRFDSEEFVNSCEFGPGASTSLNRRQASNPNKYALSKDITLEAYHFVKDWFGIAYPLMGDYMFELVSGSVVTTVPKNSKTDRVIAIEPDWNIFFQKGLGSMISRRLRYVGIDLRDQTINQELSRRGSRNGDLATIDFSSASDTIALELVRELIPSPWLSLIEALRSRRTRLGDESILLAKVSSMGNGFTFELESLIFYALASACADFEGFEGATIGVYGDDVVLPSKLVPTYTSVVNDCGFSINTSKSFDSGYFRESCGAYFYNGVDVKPIFLKEEPIDSAGWAYFANKVRLFSSRGIAGFCDKAQRRAWFVIRKKVPRDFPRVPLTLGDTGLIVNYNELDRAPKRASSKWPSYEGYIVKCLVIRSLEHFTDSRGLLVSRLRTIGGTELKQASGNSVSLAESTKGVLTNALVPRWVDIGEWV